MLSGYLNVWPMYMSLRVCPHVLERLDEYSKHLYVENGAAVVHANATEFCSSGALKTIALGGEKDVAKPGLSQGVQRKSKESSERLTICPYRPCPAFIASQYFLEAWNSIPVQGPVHKACHRSEMQIEYKPIINRIVNHKALNHTLHMHKAEQK